MPMNALRPGKHNNNAGETNTAAFQERLQPLSGGEEKRRTECLLFVVR